MTTRPDEPESLSSPARRPSWPWVVGGAVVVVVAVVVALVLTAGGTESDDPNTAAAKTTTATTSAAGPDSEYDLSTPQAAAKSFAAAAETGSGDTLLGLACVGRPSCISEHAAGVSEAQLAEAQSTIRDGVYELSDHLKGADFTSAVDGAEPGTKDVAYRTPAMTGGDAYLTFVQSGDDWLFYLPAA